MSKARTAAFRILRAVDSAQVDLPAALARGRADLDDERDRGLTMEIVTGSIRWQRSLDFLIEHFARRPLAKLDAEVVTILRLSLYQVLHLDRVPAAAAVDDAVDLTRLARKPSATGFVNGVLRSVVRQRHRLPLPARPSEAGDRAAALAYLGITHSHPEWLVARWLDRHGFECTERWVRFNNDTPPLTLRVNRLRMLRAELRDSLALEDVETMPTSFAPDGLTVTSGNPLRTALDGSFVVQDESSQLITQALGARPGETVLDLCAAPGGKTTAIAADMADRGVLVASDVRPRRMRLLSQTVAASGAHSVRLLQLAAEGALPFGRQFDRVLVDAPCSGLGTIRRDPDIRWRRQEEELAGLANRQIALLERAAAVVKPGGRVVYATCSSEPEENDEVVARFLESHGHEFEPLDLRLDLNQSLHPLLTSAGFLQPSPTHGLEAFFAAALVRRD
jgi:16S rRNA (cytosine967-C5)-methyltransferase